jgi:quercetin dioxygenase-like cupin family protein
MPVGDIPSLVHSVSGAKLLKPLHPPGKLSTVIIGWRPGMFTDLHRTVSADLDVVLQGTIILGLEEGQICLEKGDAVYLPGTVHSWRATKEEALVLFVVVGGKMWPADEKTPTFDPAGFIQGL